MSFDSESDAAFDNLSALVEMAEDHGKDHVTLSVETLNSLVCYYEEKKQALNELFSKLTSPSLN